MRRQGFRHLPDGQTGVYFLRGGVEWLEQLQVFGPRHGLGPVRHSQFTEDGRRVSFDCAGRNVEPGADLGVGQPLGQGAQDLQFPAGQRLHDLGQAVRSGGGLGAGGGAGQGKAPSSLST